MTALFHPRLSQSGWKVIMGVRVLTALVLLCASVGSALAQESAEARDDLDVTMHIIVDADAKVPDEVVRRIPLPARKPAEQADAGAGKDQTKPDAAAKGQERAREARELGREMVERAQERAQQAAEQREQARRSAVEERRRNPEPPGRTPGQ